MLTSGRILAVQESRFRLLTPTGLVYLFTVARQAQFDETFLSRMCHARAEVNVDFSGEPNLVGGVAHAVHTVGGV